MPPCPICGGALAPLRGDNVALCSSCGFNTGLHPALRPSFLAALPPFREIRRDPPTADLPAPLALNGRVAINGRTFALTVKDGLIWLLVQNIVSVRDPPAKEYRIPVFPAAEHPTSDLTDPVFVARAWRLVIARAATGEGAFWKELPERLNGMTQETITSLRKAGLLSQNVRETVLAPFRQTMAPGDTPNIGYAAMLFEIGVLDDLETEQAAVIPLTKRPLTPPAPVEDDGDEIPPGGEENLYYSVPVPDDLPPVDEIQISFDGGKTVWVFVASRLQGQE